MRKSTSLLLLVIMTFITTRTSHGQMSTVQGVVKDAKGQPVSGAAVSIGDKYDLTDITGKFKIKGVEKGTNSVVIKSGKESVAKTIQISESNQSEVFTFASKKDDIKNKEETENKSWFASKKGDVKNKEKIEKDPWRVPAFSGKHDHTGEFAMAPPKKAE